jgi:hypothetical protein
MAFLTRRNLILGAGGILGGTLVGAFAYDSYASATYSHGWRMGLLYKLSEKSNWTRLFLRDTGEGEIMLGVNSARAEWRGGDGGAQFNPWAFSASPEQARQYVGLEGRMVAVEYRQVMNRWHGWKGDTAYRLLGMTPIDPRLGPAGGVEVKRHGLRSEGRRIGRLVKVTRKGFATKSWEVTLQEASGGNNFLEMSLLDDEIYDAAIEYLRSGRLLSVSYIESLVRNPLNRDTNYAIIGIKPVEG